MSTSTISGAGEPAAPAPEPQGYLERAVQWAARKVLHLNLRSPDELARERLIDALKKKTMCPLILLQQFDRYVSSIERRLIYESLGKRQPLGWQDRIMNWMWRDESQINKRYREIGRTIAVKNPYLLAPTMMRILSQPVESLECKDPSGHFVRKKNT
jgi:hypothetical protein